MHATKQQQIDTLLNTLDHEELLTLIEKITQRLRQTERKPRVLYGSWKDHFPEDADIESDLQEMRGQWKEEFDGPNT